MNKTNHSNLSPYQRNIVRRYKKILEVANLDPEQAIGLADSDPTLVVPMLELMINQVVRGTVVLEYTAVDAQLNDALNYHFFGRGNKYRKATRTRRFRTFQIVLQQLYILQKLSIVETFKKIPRDVVNNIRALNDLRNGIAHTFRIKGLREHKRTFKGKNVFSPEGLQQFIDDMDKVTTFFWPRREDED